MFSHHALSLGFDLRRKIRLVLLAGISTFDTNSSPSFSAAFTTSLRSRTPQAEFRDFRLMSKFLKNTVVLENKASTNKRKKLKVQKEVRECALSYRRNFGPLACWKLTRSMAQSSRLVCMDHSSRDIHHHFHSKALVICFLPPSSAPELPPTAKYGSC